MKAALFITLLLLLQPELVFADTEMRFSGKLVEEPCSLAPEDSAIEIDFGTVIAKMLYSHKRTPGKPFTLHLLECDLSLGETVTITFFGVSDAQQTGFLALDAESTASGVAVGFETQENAFIPINHSSQKITLTKGMNEIKMLSFISAPSIEYENRRINPGTMKFSATISLNYE